MKKTLLILLSIIQFNALAHHDSSYTGKKYYKFKRQHNAQTGQQVVGTAVIGAGVLTWNLNYKWELAGPVMAIGLLMTVMGGEVDLYEHEEHKKFRSLKSVIRMANKTGQIPPRKDLYNFLNHFQMPEENFQGKVKFLDSFFKEIRKIAQRKVTYIHDCNRKEALKGIEASLNSRGLNDEILSLLGMNAYDFNINFAYQLYMLEFVEAFNRKFPRNRSNGC